LGIHFPGVTQYALPLLKKAGWAPAGVFLLHVLLSKQVLNFYSVFHPLDIPVHILGGVAMAHFLSTAFAAIPDELIAPRIRGLAQAIAVWSLTATAAVFWEFAEFFSDIVFGTTAQRGLRDTMKDLFFGIFGATLYLVLAWRRRRLGRFAPLEAPKPTSVGSAELLHQDRVEA
jgi:hypothetical protein